MYKRQGEKGFQRYYAFLSLFTMSMLGLVVATNIFQMYVFWEPVSYTHLDVYKRQALLYGMIQLQRKVKLEKFFGGVNRKENEPQNPEQA